MSAEHDHAAALSLVKRHEGFRGLAYRDTRGILTIGYGRNLEDKGISQGEAETLLANDLDDAVRDLERYPWWEALNDARRAGMISMRHQLGGRGFRKFRKTREHLENGNWKAAGDEMLNSLWAVQTPSRAREIARIMRDGEL